MSVHAQDLVINRHQPGLTDGKQHLLPGNMLGKMRKVQRILSDSHRTGGDQCNRNPSVAERTELAHKIYDPGIVHAVCFSGNG